MCSDFVYTWNGSGAMGDSEKEKKNTRTGLSHLSVETMKTERHGREEKEERKCITQKDKVQR